MKIADGLDYKKMHEKLDWCVAALATAMKDYGYSWIKAKFYWINSKDIQSSISPLISLKDRASRSVKNPTELGAFEAWYEWQDILVWKGEHNDDESEIRDMEFTHARSLLIYDVLYPNYALLPYLRANLFMATGDYAAASKLLGRITGYEVGVPRP